MQQGWGAAQEGNHETSALFCFYQAVLFPSPIFPEFSIRVINSFYCGKIEKNLLFYPFLKEGQNFVPIKH